MTTAREPRVRRVIVAATAANAVGVMPFFLVGGLAPLMRADLGLTAADIGIIAAAFSAGSTAGTAAAGRLTERVGARGVVLAGCTCTFLGLASAAVLTSDRLALGAALVVAGLGNSLVQPASNVALSRGLPQEALGLAFGIKQGSIPFAALLTGLALGTIGPAVGWRGVFLLALLLPVAAAAMTGALGAQRPAPAADGRARHHSPDLPLVHLLGLAAGGFLAATAATGLGVFYVEGAVHLGASERGAGLWYAWGALAGGAGRVLWGWLGGRLGNRIFPTVAVLMIVGSLGPVVLAYDLGAGARALATIVAWAAGWGWPGLFTYGVVRFNRSAPGAATGVTQTGMNAGALAGPVVFGFGVAALGWQAAWWVCGATMALGGLSLLVVWAGVRRHLGQR